jgi:sugar phosphate permease
VSYAGFYFCRKGFDIVKGTLGEQFELTAVDLGNIGTAFLLSYMIGQFVSGAVGRRLGPRVLLLAGMAVSLACNIAFGFSNGFWTFLGFMIFNGLAQATGWPACLGIMTHWFRRAERGTTLGFLTSSYLLGSAIAKSFAAFMLGWLGWHWSFWGASLVLGAVWLLVLLFMRQKPEDGGMAAIVAEEEGPTGNKQDRFSFRALLVNRVILTMGLGYFCFKFLRYAIGSWLAYFLFVVYGLEKSQAGYASTVFDWGCLAGALFAGVVSDKLFRGRRSAVMFLMSALLVAAFVSIFGFGNQSVTMLVVLYGIIGFALSGPDSLLIGAGASDVGTTRGAVAATGIINGIGSLGPVIQEQIVPRLFNSAGGGLAGITRVNLLMLAVAVMGTMVLFQLWRQGKKRPEQAV